MYVSSINGPVPNTVNKIDRAFYTKSPNEIYWISPFAFLVKSKFHVMLMVMYAVNYFIRYL
jgi:hypothetical protein